MEYSIYKDQNVTDTVNKIKNILNDTGIELEEKITEFPFEDSLMPKSINVSLFGIAFHCSNGKGTSIENTRASAYSEFIERLQNSQVSKIQFALDSGKFYIAADEILDNQSDEEVLKKYYDAEIVDLLKKRTQYDFPSVKVPFYKINDKKVYYLPIKLLWYIAGTNGMAAGNTPEEALVQGLSEVYERYALRKILLENISMPEIPEDVWGKYERIKGLKNFIEKCGFEVYIKDASLGKNFPVVSTLYVDKKNGDYICSFGAQPSLPVAIERTLTEFAQGGFPFNDSDKIEFCSDDDYVSRNKIFLNCVTKRTIIKKSQNTELYNQLFEKVPDYDFSLSPWVDEYGQYTNKELLKFLLENPKEVKNKDIYVRDVSYLNFPAYYIYIPTLSESLNLNDKEIIKKECDFFVWIDYERDLVNDHYNIDSLISALEYKIYYNDTKYYKFSISSFANEYLLLLCYIVKRDIPKILETVQMIIDSDKIKTNKDNFILMKEYFKLRSKHDEIEVKRILKDKYPYEDIRNLEYFIFNLDFNSIKQMIIEKNLKKLEINEKKNMEEYQQKKAEVYEKYGDVEQKLSNVKKTLVEKYIQNIPNQENLKEVFDFI